MNVNVDTIRMFFQNEKNKLIGVIVVTCLITTAIVAPITYFGGQPKYKGVIKPVSFDTMTSTGEHLADYGDLDVPEGKGGWDNDDNMNYVIYDEPLTRSVLEIKNAIGFQALNVANTQARNITENPNYELNIMSAQFDDVGGEEGNTVYVDPNNLEQAKNYQLVAPINIYMRVPAPVSIFFKENLMSEIDSNNSKHTIWEANWSIENSAGIYDEPKNPNNLNNKDALSSYYDWVMQPRAGAKSGYLADLVMAYTFFNWMLLDMATNSDVASYLDAPESANNPNVKMDVNDFAINLNQMLINVTCLLGDGNSSLEITQEIYNQTNLIRISGTGTADPYTKAELSTFNDFLKNDSEINGVKNEYYHKNDITKLDGIVTDVSIKLTDEGSSTAWYMPKNAITLDTDGTSSKNGDWVLENNAPNSFTPPGDAFLATQSRRSHYGVEDQNIFGMSQWGYGYQPIDSNSNQWDYMKQPKEDAMPIDNKKTKDLFGSQLVGTEDIYNNEIPWDYATETSNITTALPLGFTATTDPLVFYTDNDTTFEHDGVTMKPTGMTPEATKLIFENPTQAPNITWDFLYISNLVDANEIK